MRIIGAFIFGLWWLAVVHAAGPSSPQDEVEAAVSEILRIINDASADRRTKSARIQWSLKSRFDFRTTAKSALAQNWRTLTEPERDRFVELFSQVLIWSYLDTIEGFALDASSVRYLDAKDEGPGRARVSTHIPIKTFTLVAGTGKRLSIGYRLRQDQSGWRIYDVIVEGFSVIGTYRKTFRRVINRKGVAGLFKALVAELDGLKKYSMGLSASSEAS